MTAKIYHFPVERRNAENVSVMVGPGTTATAKIDSIVTGTIVFDGEPWWADVPPITMGMNDRRGWMKIGRASMTAKRHRVISLYVENGVLMAAAACGRRAMLTEAFNDAISGGDCQGCRRRGWR